MFKYLIILRICFTFLFIYSVYDHLVNGDSLEFNRKICHSKALSHQHIRKTMFDLGADGINNIVGSLQIF